MTDFTLSDHDMSAELAALRSLLPADAPAPSTSRRDGLVKSAIAGVALVPTVLGAIAAGAAELEAPPVDAPIVPVGSEFDKAPVQTQVLLPRRLPPLPALPGAKSAPAAAPDFSFSPRFQAMLDASRPVKVASGRRHHTTLYRVAPGDTLYAIAQRTLGSGARWRTLYEANRDRIASPSLIRIGQTLRMPDAPEAPVYHVAKGDSLYLIAAKRLNNPQRWREIATLNRAQLKGGVMIRPNQVLMLPNG